MTVRMLRKRTALCTVLFSVLALGVTFFFLLHRQFPVRDIARASAFVPGTLSEVTRKNDLTGADLYIPFPRDAHAENVRFENRFLSRELHVYIETSDEDFFLENAVSCDPAKVTQAQCVSSGENGLHLVLSFDTLYDYEPVMEDSGVFFTLVRPAEKYARVVVLDPVYGGTEDDAALQLAERVRELTDDMGTRCKVYVTRTPDSIPGEEEVLRLIRLSGADRYLRITLSAQTDVPQCAVLYNDRFYIRQYGNAEFATDTARAFLAAGGVTPPSVAPAERGTILDGVQIPAAAVRIDGFAQTDAGLREEMAYALAACLTMDTTP